jgi:hypothetical protein
MTAGLGLSLIVGPLGLIGAVAIGGISMEREHAKDATIYQKFLEFVEKYDELKKLTTVDDGMDIERSFII